MTLQVEAPPQESPVARPLGGNTLGRRFGLTLFTPIRWRWLPVLRAAMWLGKWVPMAQRHILQFNFIHHVRWTIVKEMPYNGPPQQRDRLHYRYLFFESNFDSSWQEYIDAFAYCIPNDIRFVWGRGINFPAPPPAEPLKRWIAENSMEGGSYYAAFPNVSTRMVKSALAVESRFERLLEETRGLPADEFRRAYDGFLVEMQAEL